MYSVCECVYSVCMYIMCTHMCTYMYVCMYLSIYMCMYIYIYWCALYVRIYWCALYREQRTHDLEHRARYQALRERWEVLDRVVGGAQDTESGSEQLSFYLELSDDEDSDPHTTQRHGQLKKSSKVLGGWALFGSVQL